jgi:hypothetical protein
MKTIINSSEIGMLRHWTNLVQAEEGDGALQTVQDFGDLRYQKHPAGSYLIQMQPNQQGAPVCYAPISEKKAARLMAMTTSQAVAAMEREVA